MSDTIFSKIIAGEIPCHKVYEDDQVLAFLDIHPISEGHTLIIPKEAAATIDALSDEASAAIGKALPRIARAVMQVSGCEHYNILQNNGVPAHQAVFHVHFHIIPKHADGSGLGIGWKSRDFDHGKGAEMARAMAAAIGG